MSPSPPKMLRNRINVIARVKDRRLSSTVRNTLRYSIYEGATTQIFLNLTAGSVLTGYMLHNGATPNQLAMLIGLPFLALAASPIAAWLESHYPHRKTLTILSAILGRGSWILAVLAPLLIVQPDQIANLLLLLVAFSGFVQCMAGTFWTAWMGDVVPERIRGRYFGLRGGIIAVAGVTANMIVGKFLDVVPAPLNYQLSILAAVIFAIIGIYLYTKHWEPPSESKPVEMKKLFEKPLKDANFRRFARFALYWQFSVVLGGAFVYPYFISELQLSYVQIALWTAIASVTTLFMGPRWGRVADLVGNKAVLQITTVIAGLFLPATWIAAASGYVSFIWVSAVIEGIAWSAINPAMFNLALATSPKTHRILYIAMLNIVSGIAGFMAALVAGPLLTLFEEIRFTIYDFHWSAYHWLFVLSGTLRCAAWIFVKPVKETRSWRARDVLRGMMRFRLGAFPWRIGA